MADGELTKLTVNITQTNAQALHRASEVSGDNRTDCVNRAIALYAFLLERVFLPGHRLFVKDNKGRLAEITGEWINDEERDDG